MNLMQSQTAPLPWTFHLAAALSLSLGWGIRGNYGHEYGAMIPGALAALAVCLMSGRPDWHRRAAEFAWLGALGWSFGGSISYMQVVAYTHSGHSPSVLYGFACLFVIGFLWAAPGGAGTALAAVAPRRFLSDLLLPMSLVFALWWLQGVAIEPWLRSLGFKLNWYDTDWLAALLAIAGGLLALAIRRRLDAATGLVLSMAVGWWAGFAILVLGLDLHMTPPRGDNWAGCLGLTIGALWWLRRAGLGEAARAGLVCGFIGGIGFAAASMLKLVEVTSGYQTNWHSILEQTTGLFNGLALAVAMATLARSAPAIDDATDPDPDAAVGSPVDRDVRPVLRRAGDHVPQPEEERGPVGPGPRRAGADGRALRRGLVRPGLPADRADLPGALAPARRRPLAIVPPGPMGRGQLLYVVLLWWVVAGNFERIVVSFTAQRLVTEGVIGAVALACTLIVLAWPPPDRSVPAPAAGSRPGPSLAGADARGGPGGGGRRHRRQLGGGPRRLRRSLRGPRQPAHPVRPRRDHPPGTQMIEYRAITRRSGEHAALAATAACGPRAMGRCGASIGVRPDRKAQRTSIRRRSWANRSAES